MDTYMNDDLNEDWIKTLSWDLNFDTLAGLFSYLGVTATVSGSPEQKAALAQFTKLPAWEAAPDSLKQEADEWLASRSV